MNRTSRQRLGAGISLLLAALSILGGGQGQAQANAATWTRMDAGLPTTLTLTSVYLINGTDDAWVGGFAATSGQVYRLHRQGNGWTVQASASFRAPIRALAVVSDDNVWAVGDSGLIIHKDRDGWQEVANPLPHADLTTIQMFGDGEAGWAGGYSSLLQYQGGTWQAARSITPVGGALGLHFGSGVGYAVTLNYGVRYANGQWTTENIPCRLGGFSCSTHLYAVRTLSADEAWAVGSSYGSGTASLLPRALIMQRSALGWQAVVPDQYALADDVYEGTRKRSWLNAISFAGPENGLAVGWQSFDVFAPSYPLIASYEADKHWHYEALPYSEGALNAVSHADATHALAVGSNGLILGYGYGGPPPAPWPVPTATPYPPATPTLPPPPPTTNAPPVTIAIPPTAGAPTPTSPNPTRPIADPHDPAATYYAPTGHTLRGPFRAYWQEHGGLAQFGYPLTEEFQEEGQIVQYFERNRFESHPENVPPYNVLLGLLGRTVTAGREGEPPFQPAPAQPTPGGLYTPETRHNIAAQFAAYWQTHGGLPVYGYPISEPLTEINHADGQLYLVQYFERNRLEYHPNLPEPYRVSLGLLGTEVLRTRGLLP